MKEVTVNTKEELQQALDNKVDHIIVANPELAKHIKVIKKMHRISKYSLWLLGGMAAATLGVSVLTGGAATPIAIHSFAATAATTTGLSGAEIVAIVTLGCGTFLGFAAILKGYDVVEIDGGKIVIHKKESKKVIKS